MPLIQIQAGTRIRTVEHKHESSAKVIVVTTVLGSLYVKGPAGPEGNSMLLREWVGTRLADALGLQTFHYGVIIEPLEVGEGDVLLSDGSRLRRDAVFASKREMGVAWEGGPEQLCVVGNASAFSRLVVFDTWVRNMDRYVEARSGRAHANIGNVFISDDKERGKRPVLLAIDHTHVLGSDAVLDGGGAVQAVCDATVYGRFPEFRGFLKEKDIQGALTDLSRLSFEHVRALIATTPECWGMTSGRAISTAEFLLARARFLHLAGAGRFL